MKQLLFASLLITTLCSAFTCSKPAEDLGFFKTVTVDFSGQNPNHSELVFVGENHQGTFHVNSDNGITQTIHLPNHGKYTIDWNFNPAVAGSDTFFLDDADGVDLEQLILQAGSTSANGLTLSSSYSFRSTSR